MTLNKKLFGSDSFVLSLFALPMIGLLYSQYWLGVFAMDSLQSFVLFCELLIIFGFRVSRYKTLSEHIVSVSFFGWLASSIVTLLLSQYVVHSLFDHLLWIVHILFAYHIAHLLRDKNNYLIWSIVAIFIALSVNFICRWYMMPDPVNFKWSLSALPLANIRHFGYMALYASVILLVYNSYKKLNFLSYSLLCYSFAFLIWTGGRGGVLTIIACFILCLLFVDKNKCKLSIVFISAYAVGYYLQSFYEVNDGSLSLRVHNMPFLNSWDEFTARRASIWLEAIQLWLNNPLWGAGSDTYQFYKTASFVTQPHNTVLFFLNSWGLVGCSAFLLLILGVILRSYRKITQVKDPYYLMAIGVVTAAFIQGMIDGNFYHPLSLFCIAIAFGFLINTLLSDKKVVAPIKKLWLLPSFAVLLLAVINLSHIYAMFKPSVIHPHSFNAWLLKTVPTTTLGFDRAFTVWMQAFPLEAYEWVKWGQQHTPNAWYYYYVEGKALLNTGHPQQGAELLKLGKAKAPLDKYKLFDQALSEKG